MIDGLMFDPYESRRELTDNELGSATLCLYMIPGPSSEGTRSLVQYSLLPNF